MEKQNVIARLSTGLKHERLAYKICGIVAIVLAALIIVIGIITMAVGSFAVANEATSYGYNSSYYYDIDDYEIEFNDDGAVAVAGVSIIAFSSFYISFGTILLAVGIVNLVMASKVGKYRQSDELTAQHAGSVGSIVVAAIFNEIALIFVIINFVFAKKNRAVLEG